MLKPVFTTSLAIIAITLGGCAAKPTQDPRLTFFASLFTGAEQYENFNRIVELTPVSTLSPSSDPYEFPEGASIELPQSFTYADESVSTEEFLDQTDTTAVLVLKDGEVRFETYRLTGGRAVNWLSMSVAKSFISALVGIAVDEGYIKSIEEPVTLYVPSLLGSAYDNVRIKDILQMSSGAKWNEDYSDPESDIGRLGGTLASGESLNDFSSTLVRETQPGTRSLYNSTDTQVLGQLLVKATGRSITDYMQEKLWDPLGMEASAHWIVDNYNMEMAFGGLNATARDYAKLGELYRNRGRWGSEQVVPDAWVKASVVADAPHLTVEALGFGMGYGYQWWLMDGDEGEYSAIGVYNQFVYVNPTHDLVIVKLSASSDYAVTNDESSFRELETIEFFRSIRDQLVSVAASTTPLEDSVVFAGLAYFVTKPEYDRAASHLRQQLDPELVEYLSGVNQRVRDDPDRRNSRLKVCQEDATEQEIESALQHFERTTKDVWVRLYESSAQDLSNDMYATLTEAVQDHKQSFSYVDFNNQPYRNDLVDSLCRRERLATGN
ncbi:MAG: serine hydrolase domain-containing protein [Pseudomonadales bacterium]